MQWAGGRQEVGQAWGSGGRGVCGVGAGCGVCGGGVGGVGRVGWGWAGGGGGEEAHMQAARAARGSVVGRMSLSQTILTRGTRHDIAAPTNDTECVCAANRKKKRYDNEEVFAFVSNVFINA